jgi:hypothetical protein
MRLPAPGRWWRLLALGFGFALLVWLSVEDVVMWPAALFGLGLSSLIVILSTLDKIRGRWLARRYVPVLGLLLGAAVGLGTGVTAAGLMFFKNAMHAHVFPDYPAGLILAMLERAPLWMAAGALAGLGLGLAWLALRGVEDE